MAGPAGRPGTPARATKAPTGTYPVPRSLGGTKGTVTRMVRNVEKPGHPWVTAVFKQRQPKPQPHSDYPDRSSRGAR